MRFRDTARSRRGGLAQRGQHRAAAVTSAILMVAGIVGSTGGIAHAAARSAGTSYRHGVIPPIGSASLSGSASGAGGGPLVYGGGNLGVGVTTGPPQVYLIFWGSQWGAVGANSQGYTTLSKDLKGMAPALQAFMNGLGSGETWSGVMTQYCEGVAAGATSCGPGTAHVAYPSGGALAGVWADNSIWAPKYATGHQLAAEAVRAARHFGNTAPGSNRNTQYFIVSAHGNHPDGFPDSGFCAWHDYSTDPTLPGGAAGLKFDPVAFTNMPYVTDAGASCGVGAVNSGAAGSLDGVTIVGGHEYAETITDQFPNGGWIDSSTSENGDKCAWIHSGSGAMQNLLLPTGRFAIQSTWSNDVGGCRVSHAIVS